MDIELKLGIFIAILFLFVIGVSFMIIMNTIGGISHALERLQEIISKEVILTHNQKIQDLQFERQRRENTEERKKRQEALLNVPLIKNDDE
ncbi:MAG: hypothetical protein OCD01_04915 [Fibrobacterales bacterium]